MSKQIQLIHNVSISLPIEGDKYGIENLKSVAKFAGKTRKKIIKYKEDRKYSFREKIGSISILTGAVKLGSKWKEIKDEFFDQTNEEQLEIVQTLVDEFNWSFEAAQEYYVETVDLMIFIYNYFNRDIEEMTSIA